MLKHTNMLFVVAAAMVDGEGRVLVQQRPEGTAMAGLWEFPGGKVDAGEVPEVALARELEEELGVCVDPATLKALTFASTPVGDRHLILLLYATRDWEGEPRAIQASALQWLKPAALHSLEMPPADIPFIRFLEGLP